MYISYVHLNFVCTFHMYIWISYVRLLCTHKHFTYFLLLQSTIIILLLSACHTAVLLWTLSAMTSQNKNSIDSRGTQFVHRAYGGSSVWLCSMLINQTISLVRHIYCSLIQKHTFGWCLKIHGLFLWQVHIIWPFPKVSKRNKNRADCFSNLPRAVY